MIVHSHKSCEMDSECTLHNSIVRFRYLCAKKYQIQCRFDKVLTNTSWVIFWHTLYVCILTASLLYIYW